MYASSRSSIKGVEQVTKVLRTLPDRVQDKVSLAAIRAGARIVAREAIDYAPSGTEPAHPKYGRLRDNIGVRTLRDKDRNNKKVAVHTGRAYWAMFLEFGTRFMAARPFMRPALYHSLTAVYHEIGRVLGKGVEREAAKLRREHPSGRRFSAGVSLAVSAGATELGL